MLLVALVAVAGCGEQSRVDPDAAVTVTGRVVAADGTPAAGRPVRLGTGVTVGEGAFAVLTVGLSCTTGACTGNVRDASTDGDGQYSFSLQGKDTQSSFGEASSVLVSAFGQPGPDEVSGAMSSARFLVQTELVNLPPLELVDPGLTVESADGVRARWAAPRAGPYELSFEDGLEVPVWLVRVAESTATIDPRVLEDTAGRVVVSGAYEDAVEGSKVELRWRSPGVPYAAGAGAPPSRGRSCRYLDAAGVSASAPGPCELTDADLVTVASAPPICTDPANQAACTPAAASIIDLDAPVPAELVVVRGCEGGCAVEVSADGTSFRPAGAVAEGFGTVGLDGQSIRAVKVSLGSSMGLREVSVWGPGPVEALRRLDDGEQAELAAPYGGGGAAGGGRSALVVILAVAAAGAVLVGIGVALGRRRSPAPG